jgi:hypothetical protein
VSTLERDRVTEVLGAHRWKDMGPDWCSCECGAVLREIAPTLAAFPGDVLFRQHLADAVLEQVGERSNVTIGDHRLTWQELADRQQGEIRRLSAFATMISDLDRNEHGRHEGDVDGWTPSEGNPHIRPGEPFGYTIHGARAYVMPVDRALRGQPEAWLQQVPEAS